MRLAAGVDDLSGERLQAHGMSAGHRHHEAARGKTSRERCAEAGGCADTRDPGHGGEGGRHGV